STWSQSCLLQRKEGLLNQPSHRLRQCYVSISSSCRESARSRLPILKTGWRSSHSSRHLLRRVSFPRARSGELSKQKREERKLKDCTLSAERSSWWTHRNRSQSKSFTKSHLPADSRASLFTSGQMGKSIESDSRIPMSSPNYESLQSVPLCLRIVTRI